MAVPDARVNFRQSLKLLLIAFLHCQKTNLMSSCVSVKQRAGFVVSMLAQGAHKCLNLQEIFARIKVFDATIREQCCRLAFDVVCAGLAVEHWPARSQVR